MALEEIPHNRATRRSAARYQSHKQSDHSQPQPSGTSTGISSPDQTTTTTSSSRTIKSNLAFSASITKPIIHEIPLAHPDYASANARESDPSRPPTLLEIAAVREAELRVEMAARKKERVAAARAAKAAATSTPSGWLAHHISNLVSPFSRSGQPQHDALDDVDESGYRINRPVNDDEQLGPIADGFLYASALCAIHFLVDVLVYTQYGAMVFRPDGVDTAQFDSAVGLDDPLSPPSAPPWRDFAIRTGRAFPVLLLATGLMHTRLALGPLAGLRQIAFLAASVAAGMNLLWNGNQSPYYAIMKQMPPVVTVWVWSVVELDPMPAALSLLVVAIWAWWKDFGLF